MGEKEEAIKKMMNLIDRGDTLRKPDKDIKTMLLRELGRETTNDVKKEYFKLIKECELVKTALIYSIKNNNLPIEQRQQGERLIQNLTAILKQKIISPAPKIQGDTQFRKYGFYDGSEATLESYNLVKDTVLEVTLFNKINELKNICSDALGFITQIEKTFWHKDDGIEEIDPTQGETI